MKKSQITIFFILGIVMVMIVVTLLLLTRYAAKKTSRQETIDVKEAQFDVQPIKNFVGECLSVVSKEGLKLMGRKGGYLFISQGGTLIDYPNTDEGIFFVNHENNKVVYNILKPRFSIGKYFSTIPNYPWKTFPYEDESKTSQSFKTISIFGTNNLPPSNKSFGPHSMQEQLEIFVTNNIDSCLDFSIFEDQGFDISKKEKNIAVDINENDVVFRMQYQIIIENLVSGEKTKLKDFLVRHNIRLGKLHTFVNRLIESDISDIKFNIINNTGVNFFDVDIKRDVYNNDDLIIITDQKSLLDSFPYKYTFARKNRNPALFYLAPEEIELPMFDELGNLTIITNETIIGDQKLIALDPDEDLIDKGSFSINPKTPITLIFPKIEFIIEVTDGELKDYQIITILRR